MIYLRYLRENTAKISENLRLTSGFVYLRYRRAYRVMSKGAGIRMNTAPPTRVQYSWFVRAQGYNKVSETILILIRSGPKMNWWMDSKFRNLPYII